MDWSKVGELLWTFANSPAGIALAATAVVFLLNRLYGKKPAWQKFEGSIVSAVKLAEKGVPDDTESKGLARFDAALKYVLQVYQAVEGKRPSVKVEAELKEGINLVHAKLEKDGNLGE